MANEINIYAPRYLAEVVRTAPPVHTFFRDTFFTNHKTFATERVDIDIKKGSRKMAAFVHPLAGGKVLRGEGYRTESYKPPLINPYSITTADQLLTRLPGEDIYSGKTPAQRAAEKLTEEYDLLNAATTRREEWMAAQAIINGEIRVVGEGINEVIDFGLSNKINLTGDAQWGKTKAKVLDNLDEWESYVLTNGFANVDMVVMGSSALKAFLNDADVLKHLDNRRVEMGIIHPKDLPNGVRYIAHLDKPNVDIYEYREVYLDDWSNPGTSQTLPLVPKNKIIMISSQANYMMAYGVCTYLNESEQWVSSMSERIFRSYIEHNPDRRIVELQSHPLPIPDKADSWLVAAVCE